MRSISSSSSRVERPSRSRLRHHDHIARLQRGHELRQLRPAIAEFERDLIRERTGDGRKRAMANGVRFGRKPKLSPFQRAEALKRRAAGETLASIAKSYAVDISMISRLN
jgi:DNA invertase Pin-like site-specific DNA recombinase